MPLRLLVREQSARRALRQVRNEGLLEVLERLLRRQCAVLRMLRAPPDEIWLTPVPAQPLAAVVPAPRQRPMDRRPRDATPASQPLVLRHSHSVPPAAKRVKVTYAERPASAPPRINTERILRQHEREFWGRWTPTLGDRQSGGSFEVSP